MFAQGESVAEVCANLGITKDTFYAWVKKYPDFSDAYQKGLALSESWWSNLGRLGAAGMARIQPATWVFNMKNRFSWADRIEQKVDASISGGLEISHDVDEKEWLAAVERQQSLMKGVK